MGLWLSISGIFMTGSATVATHTALNVEVVPEAMKSFASGATISLSYIGFAAGSLIPGILMDLSNSAFEICWDGDVPMRLEALLDWGFFYTCMVTLTLLMSVRIAARAAERKVDAASQSFVADMKKRTSVSAIAGQARESQVARKSVLQIVGE